MEKNTDQTQPKLNRENPLSSNPNVVNQNFLNEYFPHKRTAVIDYNGEEYHYDVSDRCQFRSLKKMIQASLKIRRSLVNFCKMNGERLDYCDDTRLVEIFPNERTFYLKIKLAPKEAEINSSRRKIYLDNYCDKHLRKYLGNYCFTCKKSFCFSCYEENLHKGHNYMEKYDYLQNSKFLVDESFKNITETINSTDYSLKESCEELLNKNDDYFDSVIEMIKSLKLKTRSYISDYAQKSNKSFNNLKINLEIIKDTCAESLEELKEKLIMENIVCCEETFLEFDNKYRSLKEEEKTIEREKANYQELLNYFKILSNSVNNLYEDITSYVAKKDQDFTKVLDPRPIENNVVNHISELQISEIQNKILQNVKEGYFINPRRENSNFNKTKYNMFNTSNISNSDITESYIESKNQEVNKCLTNIFDKENPNISNLNACESTNLNNHLDNKRTVENNDINSIPTQNKEFLSKQAFSTSEDNTTNHNNLNQVKDNNGTSNIFKSDNKIFSNFNTISPIAERTDKDTNNQLNLFNHDNPNRTVVENLKNDFITNDDDNCWKMSYNTANRSNRVSYNAALNDNKNIGLTVPKMNYDANQDKIQIPTFNILNKPDYVDNLANSKIDICTNVDSNKFEIDVNIKYPSIEASHNKQLSNLDTKNNESDNQIFTNIPIKIDKEFPSEANKNEPKPDKMDIVSNFENKEDSKTEESKTFLQTPKNLRKTSASNFFENVSKISQNLQLGKSTSDATNEIANPSTSDHNLKPKKNEYNCSCIGDLFEYSLKYNGFVAPIPCTNKIKIYHENIKPKEENKFENSHQALDNGNEDEMCYEICETAVDFPVFNFSRKKSNNSSSNELSKENQLKNYFFKNSAFLNKVSENDIFRLFILYVSGGSDPRNDCDSSRVLQLNFNERKLHSLPDMLEARSYHSMIDYDSKFLFVVGGKDKNTCEKYNLSEKSWTKMPNLKSGERRNPGLMVYKDFLYAFFGWTKTGCLDNIERIGLRSAKAQWEILSFKKGENVNLGIYGFAIFPDKIKPSEIFILGGRNESETLDSILKFDFNNKVFSKTDVTLPKRSFFRESQLIKLSQGHYGHFNNEQLEDIVRLD